MKLTREFDSVIKAIGISPAECMVNKDQVFGIMIKLMFLKSPDLLVSEFV